jgi:hypothetical protein
MACGAPAYGVMKESWRINVEMAYHQRNISGIENWRLNIVMSASSKCRCGGESYQWQ